MYKRQNDFFKFDMILKCINFLFRWFPFLSGSYSKSVKKFRSQMDYCNLIMTFEDIMKSEYVNVCKNWMNINKAFVNWSEIEAMKRLRHRIEEENKH